MPHNNISETTQAPSAAHAYAEAMRLGVAADLPDITALRARILRGRQPADFELLGDAQRSLVFFIGPDALASWPGKPVDALLDDIGYTREYVAGLRARRHTLCLVVWEGGNDAPLATWDAVLNALTLARPELAADVAQHRDVLRTTPFAVLTAAKPAAYDWTAIDLAGPDHPDFVTLERYLTLSPSARADPLALRRYLYYTEHLTGQFTGTGFTQLPDGSQGPREYVAPNQPLAALPGAELVELF